MTTQHRGWWPMIRKDEEGRLEVTAKVDMEYQMWMAQEAELDENKAGPGRSQPNQARMINFNGSDGMRHAVRFSAASNGLRLYFLQLFLRLSESLPPFL